MEYNESENVNLSELSYDARIVLCISHEIRNGQKNEN